VDPKAMNICELLEKEFKIIILNKFNELGENPQTGN
jgi:hypothetical protein